MARRIPIASPAFAPPDMPPDELLETLGEAAEEVVAADCASTDAAEVVDPSDGCAWWEGTRVSLRVLDSEESTFLETTLEDNVVEGTVECAASEVVATEVIWDALADSCVGVVSGCCVDLTTGSGATDVLVSCSSAWVDFGSTTGEDLGMGVVVVGAGTGCGLGFSSSELSIVLYPPIFPVKVGDAVT